MRLIVLVSAMLFSLLSFATEVKAPPAQKEAQLDRAIAMGDLATADQLISELKNVDIFLGKAHETPLTLAAMNSRPKIVKLLIDRSANVNHQMDTGYTALMFAALGRVDRLEDTKETIRLLLGAGANKSLKNKRGETALDIARLTKKEALIPMLK